LWSRGQNLGMVVDIGTGGRKYEKRKMKKEKKGGARGGP